jgi:hypothetical protein
LNLGALLLLGIALALVFQNLNITETQARFLNGTLIDLPLGGLLAINGLLTGAAVFLKALELGRKSDKQQQKTSRELERKEVIREEAESKVKVLESKILTLEKALSEALKR